MLVVESLCFIFCRGPFFVKKTIVVRDLFCSRS